MSTQQTDERAAAGGLPSGEPRVRRRPTVSRALKLALVVAVASVPTLVVSPHAAAAPGPLTGVITGPPPIAALPPAGPSQPPASAIASLITPGAVCGGWQLTNSYAGQPAASTWWKYSCELSECMGQCNADVIYARWIDHYVWDGSQAVFYGQDWEPRIDAYTEHFCFHWWDEPTGAWYALYCAGTPPPDNIVPTASFTAACVGLTCTLDASASTDPDGVIVGYHWYFGDWDGDGDFGQGTGRVAEHTYLSPGTWTIRLDVYDDLGGDGFVIGTVTVTAPANSPPTPSFTASCSGLQCSFDGSGSTDADGTIQTYGWSFGDGTATSGTIPTASHTYGLTGTYPVTLTVTDNNGNTAVASRNLAVTNAAPTTSFTVSCTGLGCSFDASGSTDLDGTIASYSWSFGDGDSSAGPTTQHVYGHAGSFTVELTLTDNAGATSHETQVVVPITLTARAYKTGSVRKVDLTWTGPNGSVDIHRSGVRVATVQATTYTDTVGKRGSYTYTVCPPATAMCSSNVSVNFP